MSSLSQTVLPVPVVMPEAEAFVKERGLETVYRHMLQKTPELFPTARSIRVLLEPDRDTPDHYFFTFEVRAPLADVLDRRAAQRRWGDAFWKVSPRPVTQLFSLDLIRED